MAIEKASTGPKESLKNKQGPKKRLTQLKEDVAMGVQTDTLGQIQQLEAEARTATEKKEYTQLYLAVREQNEQGQQDATGQDKAHLLRELQAYFAHIGLTTTDFDAVFDDILDQYDSLKKRLGPQTPGLETIARRIKANRLMRSNEIGKMKNEKREIGRDNSGIVCTPRQERDQALSQEMVQLLPLDTKTQTPADIGTNFLTNAETIQYCVDHIDDLDEETKKKLLQRIQELIALFFEGKLLEIYEITIDPATGTIIIRGKSPAGQPVVVTIPQEKIGITDFTKLTQTLETGYAKLQAFIKQHIDTGKPLPAHIDEIRKRYVRQKIALGRNQ